MVTPLFILFLQFTYSEPHMGKVWKKSECRFYFRGMTLRRGTERLELRLFPFYTIDETTSEKLRNNDRGIVPGNDKIDCKFVNSREHNFVSTCNGQPMRVYKLITV